MRLWSLSTLWVTAAIRMSEKFGVAEFVVTVMVVPAVALAGAVLRTGRGAIHWR